MKRIDNYELININGGASKLAIFGSIAAGLVFLASIIYGFIHPNKC